MLTPGVAPPHSRPDPGAGPAGALFPKVFLQQLGLPAHLGLHLLETPVFVLQGLHLTDHLRVHPDVFHSSFAERRIAHPVFVALLCDRQPPSACRRITRIWGSLYLVIFIKIFSCILLRKFYSRIPLVSGGLPTHSITWVRDKWHSAEQFETNMLAAKKNENRP